MSEPYVILDAWARLCHEAKARPRRRPEGRRAPSLSAAEAMALPGAWRLEAVLEPGACRSAKALGCALAAVARATPGEDGRALRRASSGRWYVVAGERV